MEKILLIYLIVVFGYKILQHIKKMTTKSSKFATDEPSVCNE
jgi:hypothetical protein